jgi:hypothetical protein
MLLKKHLYELNGSSNVEKEDKKERKNKDTKKVKKS